MAAELRAEGISAEGRACHIGRMEDIAAIFTKTVEVDLRDLVNIASVAAWHPDRMLGLYSMLQSRGCLA